MKRLALGLVVLSTVACAAPAARAPAPPAPESVFDVRYREAANAFEILDNLSRWWSGKCDPEYREEWQSRFGVTPEDERHFAAYKAVRKRAYEDKAGGDPDPATSSNGVFARNKPVDRIAEAFYGAPDLDAAFAALATFLEPADVAVVKAYVAAMRPHLDDLLAEDRAYPALARALAEELARPDAAAAARRIADFYGVASVPRFTVLYVHWPARDHVAANVRGRTLLVKVHPDARREGAAADVDLPVHELAHHVSALQPEAKKRALTDVFLAGCEAARALRGPLALEEPLAVVHQKAFLREHAPARFELASRWYGDPWVSDLAKALFEPVARVTREGRTLDEAFAREAAAICAKVAAARGASR
jgi:hypothetical protein